MPVVRIICFMLIHVSGRWVGTEASLVQWQLSTGFAAGAISHHNLITEVGKYPGNIFPGGLGGGAGLALRETAWPVIVGLRFHAYHMLFKLVPGSPATAREKAIS